MSEEQKNAVRPENNLVGKVLNNNYRIDRLIGAGGMGEVYEGEHLFTNNRVAIKAVLQSLSHDEKVLSLFKREARILFKLTDEAIARYLDSFHEPVVDRYCLVMDFIDGVPLSDRVKSGEVLSEAEARRLMRRVAVALDRAHHLEIVHRDLSPDNIMLRNGNVDQAVLIDFGIARSATMTEGTLHGQFAGKFKYVSPEQLGHFGGEVGPRTDIYGLALLTAAALRGKPLDMGSSIVEAVNARRAIPALDGVPPGLAPLLAHMLEPDPVNRPADMGAVVRLLDEPRLIPGVYAQWGGGAELSDDHTVIATPLHMTGAGTSLPPGTLQTGASQMPGTATSYPPPGSMVPGSMAPGSMAGVMAPSMAPGQMTTGAPMGAATFTGLPKTEPVPDAPARKKGGGLWIFLGLLVLAGAGGAGWLYMQGKLPIPGLPKPPEITEETTPDPEPKPTETTQTSQPAAPTPPAQDPAPQTAQGNAPALGPPNPATREGFLAAYRAEEPCSFATRITAGGNSGKIAVFADVPEKLPAISQAYAGKFGAAPTVLSQQVSTAQCPVLDLLRGLQGRTAEAPLVTLDADVVPSGGSVIGRIANLQGRTLWLFLVSGTGAVFDLTDRIERQPDGSALLAIGLKSDSGKPEPQLIVALASPRALVTAGTAAPGVPAASLIPAVAAEITTRKLEVGAQAAFLTLTP